MNDSRNIGCDWEDLLVVDLAFDPIDQVLDVFRRWKSCWLLKFIAVCPEVFVSRPAAHLWTSRLCAILRNCSVYEIYSIEEVHDVNCKPVVHVLAWRKSHDLSEVDSRLETRLRLLVQRIPYRSMCESFLRAKCLKIVKVTSANIISRCCLVRRKDS